MGVKPQENFFWGAKDQKKKLKKLGERGLTSKKSNINFKKIIESKFEGLTPSIYGIFLKPNLIPLKKIISLLL